MGRGDEYQSGRRRMNKKVGGDGNKKKKMRMRKKERDE